MKPVKIPLLTAMLLCIIALCNYSCKKDVSDTTGILNEKDVLSSHIPDDPGFVDNDMVMYWNEKAAAVLNPGFTQPARTRVFARIQVAVHDALNSIKPKYERYAFHEREQHANPDAAVASAAYWIMKRTTLVGNPPLDQWYSESLATIADGAGKDSGIAVGKRSADALLANRANDGFSQVIPVSGNPPNGILPGEYRSTVSTLNWVPTETLFSFRIVHNWGTVMQPWVIQSNQQFRPAAPYAVNTNEYTADFNEVKTKGARVGGSRTAAEEKMAQFWSDNRSTYLWNLITRKVIENKGLDAWKTARLFALIHVSMAESITSQLNAGYYYYSWRPETAIRLAETDGNDNTAGDIAWLPFLSETATFGTPPFPGHPNAYAANGATTAEILRLFFGSDETAIDITTTTTNPAVTEPKPSFHFTSFSQAARDNSLSMIYNGWDFRKSVMDGEEMGRQIANYVYSHAFREE